MLIYNNEDLDILSTLRYLLLYPPFLLCHTAKYRKEKDMFNLLDYLTIYFM